MEKQITELLKRINSDTDNDDQILQLALIIERSNSGKKDKAEYVANLSKEQLGITLSSDDQIAIATKLLGKVTFMQKGASLLWIIGKSAPAVLVKILPSFLMEKYKTLDNDKLLQGLFALQNCFVSEDHLDYPIIKSTLEIDKLMSVINELIQSEDERISYQAKNVSETLIFYSCLDS